LEALIRPLLLCPHIEGKLEFSGQGSESPNRRAIAGQAARCWGWNKANVTAAH